MKNVAVFGNAAGGKIPHEVYLAAHAELLARDQWIIRVGGRCHRHLTPRYRELVAYSAAMKRVHHLRSPAEMNAFLAAIEQEFGECRRFASQSSESIR